MEKKSAQCHHCQNPRPASDHPIAKNSADTSRVGVFPVRLFSAALSQPFSLSAAKVFLVTLAVVYPLWRM